MDRYGGFAYYYDDLMDDIDYSFWAEYLIKVFKKYHIMHTDILEMACGTGTMAVNLAKRGFDVTAFDISDDMLSIANSKAADNNVNLTLLKQDMRDIKINKNYGIILCLCDSINYITNKDDLNNLFLWVFQHLKEDGIFVFDINSSYKLRQVIGNNTFARDNGKLVYIWDNYLNDNDMVEFYLTFFVKEDDDYYRRFDEVHVEKIYENDEIKDMLKKVGFVDVEYCDGFTFKEPVSTSERINFFSLKKFKYR